MPSSPAPAWPRRILRGVVGVVAALWILLEEWLWDGLKRAMQWLGRLPVVRGIEARIARLGPKAAMAMFAIPWLALLPAKLLAFWLIGTGRATSGLLVFVLAKVVGTALLARLFTLTKPALLTVGWFRRLHDWFTAIKQRLFAYVGTLRFVVWVKKFSASVRQSLRAFWRRLHDGPVGS